MGYIRRDFAGPTIAKWQYSLKFKDTILRHWPTTTIGNIKVFAPLYTYQNGVGVLKTPAHLKIYKLLGIKVKDLEAGNYDGIENTYMHVPGIDTTYSILQSQIQSYIEEFSPQIYPLSKDPFNLDPIANTRLNPDTYRDNPLWIYADTDGDGDFEAIDTTTPEPKWDKDGWITTYLTYSPTVKTDVPASISDSQILGLIEAGDRNSIHFDEDEGHPLTFASILDTENILFENKARIVQKTIEERTTHTYTLNKGNLSGDGIATSTYLKTAVIEYKFRRIKDASDPLVAPLIVKIETSLKSLTPTAAVTNTTWYRKRASTFGTTVYSSVSKQLIIMYHHELGYSETALSYAGKLKYDGMATLKAKDFGKVFSKQITQGYSLKKVKWYKKALSVIITIITVVVAVVLIMSGNFAGAALVLSFGALAQSMLASYWAKHGDPAAANYAMGHAEFLQVCATVVGIYAIVQSGSLLEMTKLAAKELGNDNIDMVIDITSLASFDTTSISNMSTSQMLSVGVQYLNKGFEMYTKYIDPTPGSIEDKKAQLVASNKELEDTAGPDMLDTIEVEYSDPYNNWIDMNEKTQSMPYMMTAGKNRILMNKYYNSGY